MALPLHGSYHTIVPEQTLRRVVSPKFSISCKGKRISCTQNLPRTMHDMYTTARFIKTKVSHFPSSVSCGEIFIIGG